MHTKTNELRRKPQTYQFPTEPCPFWWMTTSLKRVTL